MIGRPVFLLVRENGYITVHKSESEARELFAVECYGNQANYPHDVYEVTGVKPCSVLDHNQRIVDAEQAKVDALAKRLGVKRESRK